VGKLLGGKLSAAKILIMGVTYKKDVKDVRESPAVDIIEEFQQHKAKVDYYDPMAPYLKIAGLDMLRIDLSQANLKKYDCVVIVTDHSDVDYKLLQKNSRLIFDTRNIYRESHKNVVKL
jgi:UDP-N-acetyl-D-glucosamine dehydrogenase